MVLAALLLSAASASAQPEPFHPALDPKHFPLPESLAPSVEFWKRIFTVYDSDQSVLHDERHLDVIYGSISVSDLRDQGLSEGAIERQRRKRNERRTLEVRNALRVLAGDQRVKADSDLLASVQAAWRHKDPSANDYQTASRRLRTQRGISDRFAEAIATSGMFMPGILRILERYELPPEIACLPFVESMFNYKARSKVGASGAWQFTRSTGRMFLQIDGCNRRAVRRSDLAADGAARLLREQLSTGCKSVAARADRLQPRNLRNEHGQCKQDRYSRHRQ